MTHRLNQENGGFGNIGTFVVGQLFEVTLALAWVWVAGIRYLWRSDRPLWRALVWAYGLLFVLFALTTGGKVYYLAAAYIYLLAAGAVSIEGWLDAEPVPRRRLLALTALTTLLSLPVVLPLLPANDIGWTYGANPQLGETVGWPELVHTVGSVWNSLPADQRHGAVIFTADYGEAGAINELGRGSGLPTAVSGHNNEWFWGPGNPHATTVVAVAPGPVDVTGYAGQLKRYFRTVRVVATIGNAAGIHNQEWGGHVYLCTGLKRPWGQTWPSLRHATTDPAGTLRRVIVWINGPFGVGKTTIAGLIREREPEWRLFDPEWVGFMLRANLSDLAVDDFQDLPPWRALVPSVAHQIASLTGDGLLAVQTVLVEEYWDELRFGFAHHGLELFHVVLDADESVLRERISADQIERGARQWRLDHLAAYESARSWMAVGADLVIDTARLSAPDAASRILRSTAEIRGERDRR